MNNKEFKLNNYIDFDLNKYTNPNNSGFRVVPTSKDTKETFSLLVDKTNVSEAQIKKDKIKKEKTDINTLMPDFYRNGHYEFDENGVQKFSIPPLVAAERDYFRAENIAVISLMNFGKNIFPPTSKFFLKSVEMMDEEKYHLYNTNSKWFINFFGERPTMYNFSIGLLNMPNYNWYNEFIYLYQMILRGTKAAENLGRVHIRFGYEEVSGFILNNRRLLDAQSEKIVELSFQFAVVKREILSISSEPNASDSFLSNTQSLNDLIKRLNPSAKKGSPEYDAVSKILNNKSNPCSKIDNSNKKSTDYISEYWKNATKKEK